MQDFLKHYNMRITALSPIHVGGGNKIGKKEYIQIGGSRQPIMVPDVNKMFQTLRTMRRDNAYAEYMLDGYDKRGLGQWLKDQSIPDKTIESWKRYSMDPGDAFVRKNNNKNAATPKEIVTFIKDAYEKPYVPGSTIKGMLRNAILCYRIHKNPSAYKREIDQLERASRMGGRGKGFLQKETGDLEKAIYNTLAREGTDKDDAVNSIMAGFIVSDSKPIDEKQLMLSQKIDVNLKGEEKSLPILREALKPGTEIDFEITIDTRICDITMEEILAALDYFNQVSNQYFYSRFRRGSKAKGTVWLGGGTGFLSKTMLYPVYGEQAVRIADKAFQATIGKNYSVHKHEKDVPNKVAPHVCKCTRYCGKLYDMGMGKIEVLE